MKKLLTCLCVILAVLMCMCTYAENDVFAKIEEALDDIEWLNGIDDIIDVISGSISDSPLRFSDSPISAFFVLIFGAILCFGGYYFRRVPAALMGGAIGAFLGDLIQWGELLGSHYEAKAVLIAVVICACLCVAIGALLYKVIPALLMGLVAYGFIYGVLLLNGTDYVQLISIVGGIAGAVLAYFLYDYYLIGFTAFSGAYSLGLLLQANDLDFGIFWIIVIVLMVLGCIIQYVIKQNE